MDNEGLIEELLEDSVKIVKGKKEKENNMKAAGEEFNIFNILDVERKEVETHSKIIYDLINPNGSHGQGNIFLKSFIKNVLSPRVKDEKPLINEDFKMENIHVNREERISEQEDNYGRIDFVISNKEYYFAVEMKIDAGDQPEQLDRYYKYAKSKNKKYGVYYLTLEGRTPSMESSSISNGEIKCRSFEKDIYQWVSDCVRYANSNNIKVILEQYKKTIKKIVYKYKGDKKIMGLINSREKYMAAIEIQNGIIEFRKKFAIEFFDKLNKYFADKLEKEEIIKKEYEDQLKAYYDSAKVTNKPALKYLLGSKNYDGEELEIRAFLEINWNFYFTIKVFDKDDREISAEKYKKCGILGGIRDKLEDEIFEFDSDGLWKYIGYEKNENLDFRTFSDNIVNMVKTENTDNGIIVEDKMNRICENAFNCYKQVESAIKKLEATN